VPVIDVLLLVVTLITPVVLFTMMPLRAVGTEKVVVLELLLELKVSDRAQLYPAV
jgi:hypothetical protein